MAPKRASVAHISVTRARIDRRPLLRRLMELYLHDLARVDGRVPDQRGIYGYPYLSAYWKERGRFPYLLRVGGRWAGFALVNKWSPLEGADWSIAEFFVLPPYRRRGLGEHLARSVFARHRGTWHVAQLRRNREATAFWRKVIGRFTHDRYKERVLKTDDWDGRVQTFVSRARASPQRNLRRLP